MPIPWKPIISALLVVAVALPAVALAAEPLTAEAERGAEYLRAQQQENGSFGPLGQTLDAVFALRAAGIDPDVAQAGGASVADYVVAAAPEAEESPGLAGKAILGAVALGANPRALGGTDLVATVEAALDPATGQYAEDVFGQSLAILGLACSANAVPAAAVAALGSAAETDGGWGYGGASDPDSTAIALQALLAGGLPATDPVAQKALAYLRETQLEDGGWGYGESNTSSTAYVVQALVAAGADPDAAEWVRANGSPLGYLASQQQADGSFAGFDPVVATTQVLPAMMGRTFCNAPVTSLGEADSGRNAATTVFISVVGLVALAGALGTVGLAHRR